MRSFRLAVLFLTISSWGALAADNAVIVTPGSGVTMRSKDIGAGVQSMMPIPGDVAGNPLATAPGSGNASYALPMQGVVGGVAMPISQATAASLNATVVGTGTFAVQATLQASATTAIGKVDPNTIATWGLATVGAGSAPTNMEVGGLVYNSGGVTPSSGQSVALQGDANGYLEVNVKTATGLAEGSTTSGQTGSMIMAATTSAPPSLTTAQTNYLSTDLNGGLRTAPSCVGNTIPINQTASTDVKTFTGYGYICSIVLISGTQQSVSISEGTGSTCATGTAYLMGGSGGTMVLAQYGGFSAVSGTPFMKLKNSADHLCVLQSSTGNVSGFITFADLTN